MYLAITIFYISSELEHKIGKMVKCQVQLTQHG